METDRKKPSRHPEDYNQLNCHFCLRYQTKPLAQFHGPIRKNQINCPHYLQVQQPLHVKTKWTDPIKFRWTPKSSEKQNPLHVSVLTCTTWERRTVSITISGETITRSAHYLSRTKIFHRIDGIPVLQSTERDETGLVPSATFCFWSRDVTNFSKSTPSPQTKTMQKLCFVIQLTLLHRRKKRKKPAVVILPSIYPIGCGTQETT